MNLAFFLTPKQEVAWLPHRATMRQALEKMAFHRYTAMPLLDEEGRYVATVTEGDLLFHLRDDPSLSFANCDRVTLPEVPRRMSVLPVSVNTQIQALFERAIDQNFVPVVDSRDVFMGIVRRKAIIEYLIGHWQER